MWSLTYFDSKKLSIFENNFLREIMNIGLQDHGSINEIQKSAKQQNSIENIIRKRRLTWFGHVCHLNDECFQKRMMKEDFCKKRNRRRPKKKRIDLIKGGTRLPVATTEKHTKDRNKWRNNASTKQAKGKAPIRDVQLSQ